MSAQSLPASSNGKVERSCTVCRRRKVRCDKKLPCSPCSRGGHICSYPQVEHPVRRARKATIKEVVSRISELEKTLTAVACDSETVSKPSPPTSTSLSEPRIRPPPRCETEDSSSTNGVLLRRGTSSHYFNEVLLSRVIEQEQDVRSAFVTPRGDSSQSHSPSPFNPMGILSMQDFSVPLASYLPSKVTAMQLWRAYVDYVDLNAKILHLPTDEVTIFTVMDKPDKASYENLGLSFAIYFAAVVALDSNEGNAAAILGEDVAASLQNFKLGLEQTLAHTHFLENPTIPLLQALTIYLSALRVHTSSRAVWTLNGLAIRAAQSMGLHIDGRNLGLSPFESEIRRRLWWHFISRDERAAEDHGLQHPFNPNFISNVDLPLNLHDSDLYPEMKQLPQPRVGWTRMTMALVNIEIALAGSRLAQLIWSSSGVPPEDTRAAIIRNLSSRVEEILAYCSPVVPKQRIAVRVARFLLRKVDVRTRQQWQTLNHPNEPNFLATEEHLLEALDVLQDIDSIWSDEMLRDFRWTMRAYPQYHMLLFVLWHICVRPEGPNVKRALATAERHLEVARTTQSCPVQGSKWTMLMALKEKAITLMQLAEQSAAERNTGPGLHQIGYSNPSFLSASLTAGPILNDVLPDWSSLLQDFQLDSVDFPMGP